MKTIIVPTDYSPCSRNAAAYAAALAQRMQARLVLYHAVLMPAAVAEVTVELPSDDEVTAQHLIQLDTLGLGLHLTYGVPVESYASPAPFGSELAFLVQKYGADLVVMGMQRLNAFDNWLYGSITTTVIRKATFPVLVVPDKVTFKPPVRLVLAADFKAVYGTERMNFLRELTALFGATLQVLHVEQPVGNVSEKRLNNALHLDRLLRDVPHEYTFVQQADVVTGIERAIGEQQADLLVMMPHQHDFLDQIMGRSQTRKMAFKTRVPLLVVPEPGR